MKRIRNILLITPGTDNEPFVTQTVLHEGEPTQQDEAGVTSGKYFSVMAKTDSDKTFTVNQYPLNTVTLIRALLDNVQYKGREEVKLADKIFDKLTINWKEDQPEAIDLEDAEFDFVQRHANSYAPYLSGRKFSPFLEALETAETVVPDAK